MKSADVTTISESVAGDKRAACASWVLAAAQSHTRKSVSGCVHLELECVNGWTNKDWLFQEMLRSGLPQIQSAFKQLFYGQGPLAERFDLVKKRVRMIGAAHPLPC